MVKRKIKQTETETRKHAHTQKKQKQNQINQIAREQPTNKRTQERNQTIKEKADKNPNPKNKIKAEC